ncbi:helix-turn-helix domain-containing protein [Dyadobacter psychrotolerans]|uniref:XRE family transcriptional regulator n=1 Tax=Dyadobacter psychrotolerans TaxID=2541721 RepID=A0A4R5DEZ9_9BACT|nr:XRE family transcriptional regulator [Dyadobacter psychrotolerans]TDE12492.1 XRE family transcriptional regulator [Dyadobacter psychrotolerans]
MKNRIKSDWFLIDNEQEYENALTRYQEVKYAVQNSKEHKEKLLLAHLIAEYEEKTSELPEVDPVELIKIRMEDFGYKSVDLAKEYGDKGTISKVLNYKQALSLTMVRKFSKFLHIPADALITEYELK